MSNGRFSVKIWETNFDRDVSSAILCNLVCIIIRLFRDAYSRGRGGQEDEAAKVGGALVAEGARGVEQRADAVGLHGRADERGAVRDGGRRRLPALEELLLRVGRLGAAVCLAKERRQNGELSGVAKNGADGDGRGAHGREVVERHGILW